IALIIKHLSGVHTVRVTTDLWTEPPIPVVAYGIAEHVKTPNKGNDVEKQHTAPGDTCQSNRSRSHVTLRLTRPKISDRWRGRAWLRTECGSHPKPKRGAASGSLDRLVRPWRDHRSRRNTTVLLL